jgi:hypothetical protein
LRKGGKQPRSFSSRRPPAAPQVLAENYPPRAHNQSIQRNEDLRPTDPWSFFQKHRENTHPLYDIFDLTEDFADNFNSFKINL